jgi:hypothetical protein
MMPKQYLMMNIRKFHWVGLLFLEIFMGESMSVLLLSKVAYGFFFLKMIIVFIYVCRMM